MALIASAPGARDGSRQAPRSARVGPGPVLSDLTGGRRADRGLARPRRPGAAISGLHGLTLISVVRYPRCRGFRNPGASPLRTP